MYSHGHYSIIYRIAGNRYGGVGRDYKDRPVWNDWLVKTYPDISFLSLYSATGFMFYFALKEKNGADVAADGHYEQTQNWEGVKGISITWTSPFPLKMSHIEYLAQPSSGLGTCQSCSLSMEKSFLEVYLSSLAASTLSSHPRKHNTPNSSS